MNDSMREFSPKPTGTPSASAFEASGIKTVSDHFKGLGEKARDVVAKMVTTKRARAALTGAAIALLISSGCSNIDTGKDVKVTIIKPSEDVTVRIIPAEATSTSGTPEVKSQGLYFDGNHVLLVPHSAELDGKKGMEINISFKPVIPEKLTDGVIEGGHLVIGGNDAHGGSSYQLDFTLAKGEEGDAIYGVDFSAGGLNTGLYPSRPATKIKISNPDQLFTINATVDELGHPRLTVNGRRVLGYSFADQLSAANIRSLETSNAEPTGRPDSRFNNNGTPILVGARLFKNGGADGGFKGTIESLQINGNNIDLSLSNLQEIHR